MEMSLHYASFGKRFWANIIDTALFLLVIQPVVGLLFTGFWKPFIVVNIISYLYDVVCWTLTGQTLGKWALGIRVSRETGEAVGFVQASMRYFGYIASWITVVGFLLPLFDSKKRALHDRIARTVVITQN